MATTRDALARFLEWTAISSASGDERAMADRVGAELADLGFDVAEDLHLDTGNAGNVLARLPGTAPGPALCLCAHLDTVPVADALEPELGDDGIVRNRAPSILGADDKAAIAAMVTAVARLRAEGRPYPDLELLLTVQEEIGLRGAKAFDVGRLAATAAFVFDVEGPVGDLVVAAPFQRSIDAEFTGRAAHAGMVPEQGRSAILAAARACCAMPHGRIDDETTANVGLITGGSARNAVPAHAAITAEARSISERALTAQVQAMLDAITDAANQTEVDVATRVTDEYPGYRHRPDAPALALAEEALRRAGATPRHVPTGGGADSNIFVARGLASVNFGYGATRTHSADEQVPAADVERMVEVTLGLVGAAVDAGAAEAGR